jgi:3-oxoacyl-[acyl-carrier protein] reductase
MSEFAGKVLLLTGAAGGIGSAIAEVFVEAGASVLLADRDEATAKVLAQRLGRQALPFGYDAASSKSANEAVAFCLERLGRLDYAVPAAAIYEEHSILTMTDEAWRRTLSINLDGTFYLCRAAVPALAEGGCIVTLCSDGAHSGSMPRHAHYGASKGGVLSLTRSLARELAPRIRVNTVSPGTIDTPMIHDLLKEYRAAFLAGKPLGRLGTGREVADAILFLCSDRARFITGQTIHINGGAHIGG